MGKPKLTKTREQHIYSYVDQTGKKKYAYRYRYTRNDGKKTDAYKQNFSTAKDAALALTKVKAELLSGNYTKVDNSDMTVRQLCDIYVKYKIANNEWKISTAVTRQKALKTIITRIGDMRLRNITKVNYQANYVQHELSRGLKPSTVRSRHSVFSAALNFAVEEEYIDKNCIDKIKIEFEYKTDAFTTDELDVIFDFIKERRPKYYSAIMTLTYTGIRVGELCGLKWGDIDFVNETISIRRTRDKLGERPPKTKNSVRTLPLPHTLKEIYLEMYSEVKKRIFLETASINHKQLAAEQVFVNRHNEPTNPTRYEVFFTDLHRYTGLKGHPHKLRHTYATLLIAEGFDVATVASLLGDNITTVQKVYVHAIDEYREKATKHLNDMFAARLKNIL